MKKRTHFGHAWAVLQLALLLVLLTGCTGQLQERALMDLAGEEVALDAQAPTEDACVARGETVTLYFLNEDGSRLYPVTRTVLAERGMSRSEAALRALLAGPEAGENAFWPDMGVLAEGRGYALSGGVATVDLPARARALDTQMLYAVRLAIANTLTEFAEVSYVNVLVGGHEEGFDLAATLPMGALSRTQSLDVTSQALRQEEIRQGAQQAGVTRMTTLYFPSSDGRYLLPQVCSVAYASPAPIEYLYRLLEELSAGAGDSRCAQAPAPMKYIEEMPEIVRTEDGAYKAIQIQFSGELDGALAQAGLTRGIYVAMLTDTLMGFVPGVDGLLVSIGGEVLTGLEAGQTPDGRALSFAQTLATREDFEAYVGAPGVLYVPAPTAGRLQAVDCVFAQARQGDARTRVTCLVERLVQQGTLPGTLGEADILAISVEQERILCNLSGAFADALAALGPQQERCVVYAMVNTLTEGTMPGRVAFFFDGVQRQTLAGGLELRGEFWRNPGMVEGS